MKKYFFIIYHLHLPVAGPEFETPACQSESCVKLCPDPLPNIVGTRTHILEVLAMKLFIFSFPLGLEIPFVMNWGVNGIDSNAWF